MISLQSHFLPSSFKSKIVFKSNEQCLCLNTLITTYFALNSHFQTLITPIYLPSSRQFSISPLLRTSHQKLNGIFKSENVTSSPQNVFILITHLHQFVSSSSLSVAFFAPHDFIAFFFCSIFSPLVIPFLYPLGRVTSSIQPQFQVLTDLNTRE